MAHRMEGPFRSQSEGVRYLRGLGHTLEYAPPGESGDNGVGSRLYFCAPRAPRNEHGVPSEQHSTLSLVSGEWYASIFGLPEPVRVSSGRTALSHGMASRQIAQRQMWGDLKPGQRSLNEPGWD